jgi:hypothetical protein
LAAIVVLAVGLFACATAPEPVHHAGREREPPVGDDLNFPRQEDLSGRVQANANQNCSSAGVDAGAREGTVDIVLRQGPEGGPLIETHRSEGLNEDDRNCVEREAYQAFESIGREWSYEYIWGCLGNHVTFSIWLRPAPPPPPVPPPEL